ncbi:DUF3240 family protein [Roseateles sp.]|uniref:DUF3240 family protein n=1 Tax=Roseateles sp. TaxID=1971397 RepID=UPI0025F21DF9|nr:DUF3240 family protein [Roseateles sp.]MBV8036188.1 DUF3240 family protein [Roseateles sp.]
MADRCLHLVCPRAAEERVLDALLALGEAGVFTSLQAHAHGFAHGRLSAAEQVSGHSEASLVQVFVAAGRLDALLGELARQLAQAGVRYWVTSVERQGEFQ